MKSLTSLLAAISTSLQLITATLKITIMYLSKRIMIFPKILNHVILICKTTKALIKQLVVDFKAKHTTINNLAVLRDKYLNINKARQLLVNHESNMLSKNS